METRLLHLILATGWFFRPQHVRWRRRGKFPQVPGEPRDGGQAGKRPDADEKEAG